MLFFIPVPCNANGSLHWNLSETLHIAGCVSAAKKGISRYVNMYRNLSLFKAPLFTLYNANACLCL